MARLTENQLPLSVAIITKNEATNLPRLFQSLEGLQPAEIIVIDSGSTDNTVAIATSYGARVIETDWPGFGEQKNRALQACEQPWILSLDADEPISQKLLKEIRRTLSTPEPSKDGYEIKRLTWYLGDWLYHAWTPEWRLRLVRKNTASWTTPSVHEELLVAGEKGRLSGAIYHYSYENIEDHFTRSIKYSRISAHSLAIKGEKFRWHKMLLSPALRFVRLLVLQQGWRDGWRGWIIAWSSMFSGFLKYAFLYEIERTNKGSNRD